jgi:uncharacterized membrane protein (UPF0127 family)
MQRDNWGKWAMGLALVLIVVAGILMISSINKHQSMVSIGGQVVYARLATNEPTRQKGLSGTAKLGDNEGMLFVFDTSGRWGIWMKDMKYNIDIIWMDSNKKIVYISQDVAPDTYPKVFLPDKDAQYVLELPAGFTAKHNVNVGQVVGFTAR